MGRVPWRSFIGWSPDRMDGDCRKHAILTSLSEVFPSIEVEDSRNYLAILPTGERVSLHISPCGGGRVRAVRVQIQSSLSLEGEKVVWKRLSNGFSFEEEFDCDNGCTVMLPCGGTFGLQGGIVVSTAD